MSGNKGTRPLRVLTDEQSAGELYDTLRAAGRRVVAVGVEGPGKLLVYLQRKRDLSSCPTHTWQGRAVRCVVSGMPVVGPAR